MKLLICVDDTDDLTKSTSTGKISDSIANAVVDMGGILDRGVTRHQLLLHDDIDYTSHNSSMCIVIDVDNISLEDIIASSEKILRDNMATGSDPGLCFCIIEKLCDPDKLIAYGKRAQNEVISKQEAYKLADEVGGIVLKEYGGTGDGVIGALAGVGLRLSGCDGTFRGGKGSEHTGKTYTAAQWKEHLNADQVYDFNGVELENDVRITLKKKLKLALLDHKRTLIAKEQDGVYYACNKQDLYENEKRMNKWNTACDRFEEDNDVEEQYDDVINACYNCLYRRWTANGFECVNREVQN